MLPFLGLVSVLILSFGDYNQPIANSITPVEKQNIHLQTHSIDDSLAIQYINLQINPLLLSEVKKYIKEQQDSIPLFKKGYGYVVIGGVQLVRKGRPIPSNSLSDHLKDIELEFNVGLSSFYPHQNLGTPLYYSFVEGRLVLIHDQNPEWIHRNSYSNTSQRKIKELIKQTLLEELKVDFVFNGITGDTLTLSSERRGKMTQEQVFELGSFTLSKLKLKTVVVYFDGSISYRYI